MRYILLDKNTLEIFRTNSLCSLTSYSGEVECDTASSRLEQCFIVCKELLQNVDDVEKLSKALHNLYVDRLEDMNNQVIDALNRTEYNISQYLMNII